MRNCINTSRCLAPSALRTPISRVRSVTQTSMMFIMTMPPTTRAIEAKPSTTQAKSELNCFQISRKVSLVSRSKSSGLPGGDMASRAHHDPDLVFGPLHYLRVAVGARVDVD